MTAGRFADFDATWFRTIGNVLVGSMIFNVYYPILECMGYWAMRVGFRILDRGCSRSPYDTKSTSIQAFIDVYAGPLYYMHFKYSSILTVSFVTFMYGFGIPIMFPIACASMIVLYFVEKTMLFYAYRVPPMYDERLS